MLKIDYSNDLVKYAEVPILKNGQILGILKVNYAVLDFDNNDLSITEREDISNIDNQILAGSFSENKVERIKTVWAKVMREVGTLNAGTMLYKNIFMLAPETKQLFPKFKHLKDDLL